MRKIKLLVTLLCLWLGLMPLAAQSVKITKELTHVQMASVLAMYKNEFGSFEKPDLIDTFPYAVIRMHLEGNAHDVTVAKERLTLYVGQQFRVEARVTTYSNQILFLVRAKRLLTYIDCGDGCDQVLLSNMQQLRSNCLYDCTVRFTPERDGNVITDTVFVERGPKYHDFKLRVEPADATVDVIAHDEVKKWIFKDGVAELKLIEGDYLYIVSAEDYHTATGIIHIPATVKDTTIRLRPTFGWLTINCDSMDLQGLTAVISHNGKGKQDTEPLPMASTVYQPGYYTISINKERFFPYEEIVTIEENKTTEVCPQLVRKVYKRNTFLLAEAGYAMNPSWGVGLMLGQVYGEVHQGCGAGWYVKGRSNFQFTKAEEGLMIDQSGAIEKEKPSYTGNQRTNELLINAGLVLNFLNKQKPNRNKRSMFGIYAGLGYGQYARSWEISDGRWIEYAPSKAKGISFGGGLIGSIKGFTINAGINTIQAKYVEVEAGLGWTF